MKKKNAYICLFLVVLLLNSAAQPTFPVNGTTDPRHLVYAFTNANIYTDYQTFLPNAVLLIKDGKVLDAGQAVAIPKGAVIHDLKGKYIYPSFIDIYTDYGLPVIKHDRKEANGPQMESNAKGAYAWNQAIKPHMEAYRTFSHNQDKAEDFRKHGFGTVLAFNRDGIARGTGVLVNLNKTRENESVVIDKAAAFYSFSKGSSTQDYPTSLTGAIALLRQTYCDAQWYKKAQDKTEFNIALDEFNKSQSLPQVFEANDKYNALRAISIGKEFGVSYLIKGGGNEYQRLADLKASGCRFIVPLNFPEAFDVDDPLEARAISLAELKHWELAPFNAAMLEKNGISFCFTSTDCKDKATFIKNLRKAVKCGLSEKAALMALTANPAAYIKANDKLGALKKGYSANFFICSGPFFSAESTILQHWVAGDADVYVDLTIPDIRGNYVLSLNNRSLKFKFTGEAARPGAQIVVDTTKKNVNFTFSKNILSFLFSYDSISTVRGSGLYNAERKRFDGKVQLHTGEWANFSLIFESALDPVKKQNTPVVEEPPVAGNIIYPFSAYGTTLTETTAPFRDAFEKSKGAGTAILIKGATVWTNTRDSVLNAVDVLIQNGKIAQVAKNIDVTKINPIKIINGEGKHLTPGIIDEHSHIALTAGVNESAQASSAEVRMGDVINPEDINIYRQLSGGVTTSQLLHGSANPIGGQSAIIKLRWGLNAEDLKYQNAPGFIKFALGENVKQSNWGDYNVVRFPQSRMGVEQVYVDYFTRASDYKKLTQSTDKTLAAATRRDLELEALAEILDKKRFITCHSYVQSEINMLMHVADSFGFKVNTFTHILEGYKVADKMKNHGVSASTFSDWWAYKNEVMEAIPHNAALLSKMGVNTGINSDDAEMARRLNQEAAKAVKYGGLSETEALKLVTLNPAKMLHIDDKVGTIEVGKTADLVLWTNNPLSVYAKADKTLIDGLVYFDREEDARLREYSKNEKARLVAKLLAEKHKGVKTVKRESKQQRLYHCNTIEGVEEEFTGHR